MQIIIPMSGTGDRFLKAGYEVPKPLIEVRGRKMIEWVVSLFPGESQFTFICNQDHLQKTQMRETILALQPMAKIISIEPHKKGPVYATSLAFSQLNDQAPTLVSYCDYFMLWDYVDFKNKVIQDQYDGGVPCYTGFHPHLIPEKNLYAGCLRDLNGMLLDIQEKFSFEKDKTKGFHSPGVYYFKSGAILKKYFSKMLDQNLHLNGEYYVSLVYKLMLQDRLNIFVYDRISHFCQWGTPEDLRDFVFWTEHLSGVSR